MSDLTGLRVSIPNSSGHGYIRYIGPILNKNGVFAGLELQGSLATLRGKNSGSVDGVQYFTVSVPKSGLFLPYERLRSVNMQLPDVKSIDFGGNATDELTNLTTPIRPTPMSRFSPMSKPPYHSVQRSSARLNHQGNDQVVPTQPNYNFDHRRDSNWSLDQQQSQVSTTPLRSPLTPSNTYHEVKLNLLDDQLYKSENGPNYTEQIEELNKLIREKDRKLENFSKQRKEWHNAMDDLIAVQQDGITVFEEKIQELEEINEKQVNEIETLKNKLNLSEQKVEEMEKERSELQSNKEADETAAKDTMKIESIEETCRKYEEQVEELQKQLAIANEEIATLKDPGSIGNQHLAPPLSSQRLISISTASSNLGHTGTNDSTKAVQLDTDEGLSEVIQDLPVYKPFKLTDPSQGKSNWCGLCERDGHSSINCPFENDIF